MGFDKLKTALDSCSEFEKITGKKAGIRGFEDRFGEYLIASRLIDSGFSIKKLGGKGVDIIADNRLGRELKIEVKTSRKTPRFGGGKKGYGWVVKKSQWKNKEYDYLACVLADKDSDNTLIFTYKDTIKYFTKCSFTRSNTGKREKDSLRLDLCESESDLLYNLRKARESVEIKFVGKPSKFEKEFNKNQMPIFKRFRFDSIINGIK